MITVYGIRQCDTCRKALKWLGERGIEHRFHDFRVDGLDRDRITRWLASEFSEQLLNRRSTTWRQLADARRAVAGAELESLLLEQPTLIKRPVFEAGGIVAVGFNPARLEAVLES
jgi:arsenate reductase